MKYFKKMVGNRIYLSPISIEDVETYACWMNDREISKYIHQSHRLHTIQSEKEWIENNEKNGDYNFAIIKKDGDKLLGNCGIMNINYIDRTATLGIFIGELVERSNGYGKEVLELLLEFCFNTVNMHNINLNVFSFNERAISCYKKVGFVEYARRHEAYFCDGKYHDIISMEILEKDYKKIYKDK